jgi:peptidoglycan/LPS O-acetylase OafA/YrhL
VRFYFIQALRGFAALWVVLFHCSEGNHIETLKAALSPAFVVVAFDCGHLGVAIFFALSGFVIAHSLRDAALDISSFGRFILRRSIRLDPPYWASMILVVGLGAISARVVGKPLDLPSAGQVVSHIFYLQDILGYKEISSVYWTLTYEVQFYIFMAGSLLLVSSGPLRLWSLTAIAIFSAFGGFPANGLFLSMWCCFFVGVLAYWARADRNSLAALVMLAVTMFWFGIEFKNVFIIISAASAVTIYAVTFVETVDAFFDVRPVQFLGAISYSLYLTHNSITGASFFVTTKLFGNGLAAEFLGMVIGVVTCIAVATTFWLLIEKPSQRLARLLSSDFNPAATRGRVTQAIQETGVKL